MAQLTPTNSTFRVARGRCPLMGYPRTAESSFRSQSTDSQNDRRVFQEQQIQKMALVQGWASSHSVSLIPLPHLPGSSKYRLGEAWGKEPRSRGRSLGAPWKVTQVRLQREGGAQSGAASQGTPHPTLDLCSSSP